MSVITADFLSPCSPRMRDQICVKCIQIVVMVIVNIVDIMIGIWLVDWIEMMVSLVVSFMIVLVGFISSPTSSKPIINGTILVAIRRDIVATRWRHTSSLMGRIITVVVVV